MSEKTVIKINGEVSDKTLKAVKEKVELLEGVISVSVKNGIVDYELNEWASDYDIMVSVLEIIADLGLDGEPVFDGDDVITSDSSVELGHNDHHDHCDGECNYDHDHCDHDHCEHDHCDHCHEHCEHDHCDHEHEGGFSCSCCDGENKTEEEASKERKGKFFELLISLGVFIVGIILSLIEATKEASSYVLLVSFVIAGYETVFNGVSGIFKGKVFSENLLMTIASLSAILLGEVPEAAGIMLLNGVGSLFESSATADVNKVVSRLKALTPETVTVIDYGVEKQVHVSKVKVNDVVLIKAGEKVGVDGVITWGDASFDTSAITGESVYKELSVGDTVLGGYLNVNGACKIEVTSEYESSTLSKIESAVKHSLDKKAKSEKFIEKFAKIYTPCVVILALLIAFIPPIFSASYASGLEVWGVRAVMLLCVSCPCALVISVPLTYFCGIGEAAKHGALVKSSKALEILSKTKTVAFDKTGTLTVGKPKVLKVISIKKYQGKVLEIANEVEKYSSHPLALALREKVGEPSQNIENYLEIAGRGVSATLNGSVVLAGNKKLLEENGVTPIETSELGMKLYLSVDGECAGVIVFGDEARPTAKGAILELYDSGVTQTVMLTGDNKEYASSVRKELKMTRSYSELLPEQKVERLEELLDEKGKYSVLAVGDGINDAPLLTRADVSIAMGEAGIDVAIESADIVLSTGDLSKVPFLVKLARRTRAIATQNVVLSLLVKLLVMVLGIVGVTSSLWLAIGADVGVLIIAILNAIRNRTRII
ncbi:MAG: cadmium-translocating P-type ATPase [Clostridia bacterium]|nr:cadmium-translocating P-type ATPase [Clostridia bacterium]